jgi:purine-binding chemotaxis protein CheW
MDMAQQLTADQSIVPVVVFCAGEQSCAIALDSVESVVGIVAVDPVPGAPRAVLGVVNFRGTVVPVVDPRRRFGAHGGELELDQKLVFVRTSRRLVALLADSIDGVEQIARAEIAAVEDYVAGAQLLAGTAPRPDGLIFIHDAELLLTRSEEKRLDSALRRSVS